MVGKVLDLDIEDVDLNLCVKNDYASKYNTWRRKEELQKLKDKYGDAIANDKVCSDLDESSSSSDDEIAEKLTAEVEKDFFKTLSYLKNKDPVIYKQNHEFFKEPKVEESENITKKDKNNKAVFIKDYERNFLLEKGGKLSDSDNEEETKIFTKRSESPTYVEEQRALKEGFKKIINEGDDSDGNEWGGLFQKRNKSKEQQEKEDAEYLEWLKGERKELLDKTEESDLKPLRDYWSNSHLESGESFLRDYILNKRYMEKEDNYIPTYDEVVHDCEGFSDDEETLKTQEEFEHKFNFRFEEPDQEFVKRYPRTMDHSLRKKNEKRKIKRKEVVERKKAEKLKIKEELKQLKALKRKEILDKIEKLKQITGNDEIGFKDEDLEGDFDPTQHDQRMQQLFNNDFYQDDLDHTKPQFPEFDDELEIENWDEWQGNPDENSAEDSTNNEPHCEDPNFNMDCDYDPSAKFQKDLLESHKGKRKRKRTSRFAQAVKKSKPLFNASEADFDKYLDEYYQLDFEDVIGDMPCRFKYRKVIPNDFGLSVEEILMADDKELNKWCSLKKTFQQRSDEAEFRDISMYKRKSRNEKYKQKCLPSIYKPQVSEEQMDEEVKRKTESLKKESLKSIIIEGIRSHEMGKKELSTEGAKGCSNETKSVENTEGSSPKKMKKRKRKRKHNESDENIIAVNSEVEGEYHKKKFKLEIKSNNDDVEKFKKKNKPFSIEENNVQIKSSSEINKNKTEHKTKKKKKNKLVKTGEKQINYKTSQEPRRKQFKDKEKVRTFNSFGKKKQKDLNKDKRKFNKNNRIDLGVSDDRLRAYGLNPKKFKNKLYYKKS